MFIRLATGIVGKCSKSRQMMNFSMQIARLRVNEVSNASQIIYRDLCHNFKLKGGVNSPIHTTSDIALWEHCCLQ